MASSGTGSYPSRSRYALIDSATMINILLKPDLPDKDRQEVMAALSRLHPTERGSRMAEALRVMLSRAEQFELDFMLSIIELLATDPEPYATAAMISTLPGMARHYLNRDVDVPVGFREYFYQALMTRRREGDREVWRRMLPKLDKETLVLLQIDPIARDFRKFLKLDAVIDRLPGPERRRVLRSTIYHGNLRQGLRALGRLLGGRKYAKEQIPPQEEGK
jgi:hypothetical protein